MAATQPVPAEPKVLPGGSLSSGALIGAAGPQKVVKISDISRFKYSHQADGKTTSDKMDFKQNFIQK